MAEKNTLTLLILHCYRCSGRMTQWSTAALFFAGGSWAAGSNPGVATSSFIFFSFIVFLPSGFLLFILAADPVSFARFLRKRISSLSLSKNENLFEK